MDASFVTAPDIDVEASYKLLASYLFKQKETKVVD